MFRSEQSSRLHPDPAQKPFTPVHRYNMKYVQCATGNDPQFTERARILTPCGRINPEGRSRSVQ